MRDGFRRLRRGIIAAAALGLTAVAVPNVQASAGPANVASASIEAADAAAAANYWTPERMASAIPADMGTDNASSAETASAETAGAQTDVAPAFPDGTRPAGTAKDGMQTELIATAVPRPYTNLPDRTIGKVFFTKATGGNFVCSGTAVNSTNLDMVDTAGHCVADNVSHKFHLNVVFVPAFASSSATSTSRPFGTWTARTLSTKSAWINTTSPQFKLDLGYIVLNTLNAKHIVQVVGGQGSRFNAARAQFFNAFGYPQAAPFNGLSQFRCNGNRLADDNPGGSGPLAIKIHCDMTGGSSGGGWLVSLAANGLGFVNGHNDYKYNNDPNSMYSPYYGPDALSLFNFAKGL